jgi:type VI secretion system protein ImpI
MTLTLRIENYRSLEGGSPIEVSSTGRSLRVGRSNGNDWVLPDSTRFISSHHFDVDFREGFWWLTDKSTNGTFLVGQPYRLDGPYRMQQGDRFQIGPYFVIVLLGAAPAVQPFGSGQTGFGAMPAVAPPPAIDYSDPWAVDANVAAPVDPTPRSSNVRRSNDFGDEFIAAPSISAPPARAPSFGAAPATPPQFAAPPPHQQTGLGVPPVAPAAPIGLGLPPISSPPPQFGAPANPAFGGVQLSLPPTPLQPPPPPVPAAAPPVAQNWTTPPSPLNAGPSAGFAGTPAPAAMPVGMPPPPPVPPPQPIGHVAPPPPPPMAAPTPPPANEDAGRAFVRAFCEGAGLPTDAAARIAPQDFARELGSTLRVVSTEMMAMLQDRATTKRFTKGGDRTMIGAKNNNPLKFLPDAKQAMEVMFVAPRDGFMKAGESVTAGMADIRLHQMAVFAAIQPALLKLLSDLSPDSIDDGTGGGAVSILSGGAHKKKAWDTFVERWDAKAGAHENGMLDVFLAHFAESYAAAVAAGNKDGKG